MNTLLDVIAVTALSDYALKLEFENGEIRIFDMRPYLNKCPFEPLKKIGLFNKASVALGTVTWPGNIDIAASTLYDKSIPITRDLAA